MSDKKYILRYLPIFAEDLSKAVRYISKSLNNPMAAQKLADDTEKAILKRLESPLAFSPYRSLNSRKHRYYRINVGNFSVFYVVIDNVMEVRRFIYSKRDIDNFI